MAKWAENSEWIKHKKESPKKAPSIKRTPQQKREREALYDRKNKEKQEKIRKAMLEREKIKIDANITILNTVIENLSSNLKGNTEVRQDWNIITKWIDLVFNKWEVKKWLDDSLDVSMSTFENLYNKTFDMLKSSKLDDANRQKIYTILEKFWEVLENVSSKDKDISEKVAYTIDKNTEDKEFIADWKDVLYAHIKRVNKKFLTHFDCLYISAEKFSVPPELLVAIMQNDSSLWKHLKTPNNPWNVWNYNNGETRTFPTMQDWIDAVAANMQERITKYKTKFEWRNPTAKEIVTWIWFNWKRFFKEYMTSINGQKTVPKIYKYLAKSSVIDTSEYS